MKKTILTLSLFLLSLTGFSQCCPWYVGAGDYLPTNLWTIGIDYNNQPADFRPIITLKDTTKFSLICDTIDLNGTIITSTRLQATQAAVIKIQSYDSLDFVHFETAFNWGNHSGLYKSISYVPSWSEITGKPTFFSGDYNDLVNRPTLFDGDYGSLTNKPNLFSGAYSDLTGKPSLFSGSYTDLTNKPKIPVPYSGTSNASGVYTVTFAQAYSVAPNIQANIVNQSATNQFIRITSISTTGFTVNVFQRNSINLLGTDVLLFSTANVSGASVDVLITEK